MEMIALLHMKAIFRFKQNLATRGATKHHFYTIQKLGKLSCGPLIGVMFLCIEIASL